MIGLSSHFITPLVYLFIWKINVLIIYTKGVERCYTINKFTVVAFKLSQISFT